MHVVAGDCGLYVFLHVTHFVIVVFFYLLQIPNLLIWRSQDQEVFLCQRRFRENNIVWFQDSDLTCYLLNASNMNCIMPLSVFFLQIPTLKKLRPVSSCPIECNKVQCFQINKLGAVVLVSCECNMHAIAPGPCVFLMGSVKCIYLLGFANLETGLHLRALTVSSGSSSMFLRHPTSSLQLTNHFS